MKIRMISICQIFLAGILITGARFELYSQEADSSSVYRPGLFVGVRLGPSQTHILNEGVLSVSDLLSEKQNSFGGLVEIGYFFSDNFGLSSGIGFESYKTQLTLATYQNTFNSTDSENEAYERRVSGTNIKEVQNIGFLSIPVYLNVRLPFGKAIGFFLQAGINVAVPLKKNYRSSGTFTYKGYYPAYNVLLENLPAYGFPSNINNVSGGDLEIKPVNFHLMAAAGFDFFVHKKMKVAIGAFYGRSISNISAYEAPDQFQLSSDAGQVNSMMGGSSKVSAQSFGVNIRLRYFLKSQF